MIDKLEINKISKKEFLKIQEKDVLFITNPGRMGDEDGMTFVVKKKDNYFLYRVDGWLYPKRDLKEKEQITIEDTLKQFPKWEEAWKHGNEKDYKGKYKYLYMGFGNGLSIDNRVYNDFKPYLDEKVKEYLDSYREEEKESLQYAAIFQVWREALREMINHEKATHKESI